MTSQPSKPSRLKRILNIIIKVIVIIGIIIGAKFLYRAIWRSITGARVVASIRATFPDFCTDGEVRADKYVDVLEILFTDYDRIWPIRCSTWKQSLVGSDIPLPATYVNLDECTTLRFIFDITDEHQAEYEAINKTNGQKLAFCP